jgi:hypothetical protein
VDRDVTGERRAEIGHKRRLSGPGLAAHEGKPASFIGRLSKPGRQGGELILPL